LFFNPPNIIANVNLPKAPSTFYYDETDTLDSTTKDIVTRKNQLFEEDDDPPQVIVAVVDSTGDLNVDEYANELFRKWKIGSKKNNGVLILYAINKGKRNVRIEVGYGLENQLTDSEAGRILNENREDLKSDSTVRVNEGLRNVFQSVTAIIDGTEDSEFSEYQKSRVIIGNALNDKNPIAKGT
jgi:uncharacterized protein